VASPLGRGNPKDSDFKTLFAGKVAPAWDLTPSPEIEIFGGIHYLDPLEKAKQILFKGASPEGTRTLVSTFGFPYASTYYFSFNYECVPGFRHTAIITDAANQVVGLQFLNNTPKEVRLWGRHRPEWHCFNFLQNRGKGTSSYLIAHVLQMGDELIPDQGGQAAQQGPIGGFTGIPNPGMPNPGMPGKDLIPLKIGRDVIAIHSELIDTRRTSREWVILCLPRKYVGVMMSVLE